MPKLHIHDGPIVSAIQSLEDYFHEGGVSLIQAAFARSYFVHPDKVRARTPYYPNRARRSNRYYPGHKKGDDAIWHSDLREVKLDDNQYAQSAWEGYTGRRIMRGSGYGLRHIWGNPWDPDAFTAGWNFCYMPFWAGMLTEKQHMLLELEQAFRQVSWDLYFKDDPVCELPDFVENPNVDLMSVLDGQPILIMDKEVSSNSTLSESNKSHGFDGVEGVFERVKSIRKQRNQSWRNIRKATKALQGKEYGLFGTKNVESGAKSDTRKICRETGLSFAQLEALLDEHGLGLEHE